MVRGLVLIVGLLGGVTWGAWPFDSLDRGRWMVWMGGHWNIDPVDMRWDPRHRLPKSPQFERLKESMGWDIFLYEHILDGPYPWGVFYTPRRVELGWGRYWGDWGGTLSYWHRHWFYGREDSLGRSLAYWGVLSYLMVSGWHRVWFWGDWECWVGGGLFRRMGYMAVGGVESGRYKLVRAGSWGSVGGVRLEFSPVGWLRFHGVVRGRVVWLGSGRGYFPWGLDWGYGVSVWWGGGDKGVGR